jgi:hypothetical protein
MRAVVKGCLAGALVAILTSPAVAQESKSASIAKQLVAAMEAAKLDTIAAKDPSAPDIYVGALYIPGFQLLVISGSYSVPVLLDARISKKEYRDVYIDLNSASAPASRTLIEDLGADGLKAKREENQGFDSVDTSGTHVSFDSDWKKQKISEEEYMKAFAAADERYARMLAVLLAQIGK